MSVKKRKASLVISWHKSFSILAPWRKGKGDAILDGDVVLTKMKILHTFNEKLQTTDSSASSLSDRDTSDAVEATESDELKSEPPRMESSTDYLSSIFTDSKLPRLYKFESEDSGVELPSGANSPSTPTGSEQSFVVHSRESSCDSCHLTPDSDTLPETLLSHELKQDEDTMDTSLSTTPTIQENSLAPLEELDVSAEEVDPHGDEVGEEENIPTRDEVLPEQQDKNNEATEGDDSEDTRPGTQCPAGACTDMRENDFEPQPLGRTVSSDSLEEYMDHCCRLSEAQQNSSNPMTSGLGYLEHICQLIEKIGQLQETNLRLHRQICGLQKDNRMTKTKEDFFRQHCSCGAASLAFQDVQKRHCRSEFLPSSGTLSDLSTIPEVTLRPLTSSRRGVSNDGSPASIPLWRRGLNRRSYTEGETRCLGDSAEKISSPQRRMSESYTWGRVKDLVRRTKLRSPGRLGLTSNSLKMSCPQLYRPDLGPVQPPSQNRNSMIVLGQHSKLDTGQLDVPWLQ